MSVIPFESPTGDARETLSAALRRGWRVASAAWSVFVMALLVVAGLVIAVTVIDVMYGPLT